MKEPAVWIWTSANRSWRSTLEPLGLFHFSSVYLFRSKGSFFFVGWLQNILTGLTKSEGPRLNLRIHPTTRPTWIYRFYWKFMAANIKGYHAILFIEAVHLHYIKEEEDAKALYKLMIINIVPCRIHIHVCMIKVKGI